MGAKLFENIKWMEVFEEDIISVMVKAAIILVFIGLLMYIFDISDIKSFIYLIKFWAYSYIVVMLSWYFSTIEYGMESITVFTGFTFIFSIIEVVDYIFDLFNYNKYNYIAEPSRSEVSEFKNEERNIKKIKKILVDFSCSISIGNVNEKMKNYACLLCEYRTKSFSYIDFVLGNVTMEEHSFTDILREIWDNETILTIKNHQDDLTEPLILNDFACDELKEIINKALDYYHDYIQVKKKMLINNRIVEIIKRI